MAVEVYDLVKRYEGRPVVDGLSFEVRRGEVFALLGPNGAGKTTTVEVLEGYRRPDGGRVRVLGLDPIGDGDRLKLRTGLMLQQGGVYAQITPREALHLFAAFYPSPHDPEEVLESVGLSEVATTRFRYLSGGQKQRLGLGLALVGRPELVFLDEPTAAMDPQARRATWELIRSLRAGGVTVLLTTHFMEEAEQLADRVAILDRGRLVALDAPGALRRGATEELRFTSDPPIPPRTLAETLGLPLAAVRREGAWTVIQARPTPALVATLATCLAREGVLVTELFAGSRSLEHVFLELTAASSEGPTA